MVAILCHFTVPIKILIPIPYIYFGVVIIILGLALNVRSVHHLKKNKTTAEYFEKPSALVKDGPFRYSRNPIYLSGLTISLGLAVLLGSLIVFIFPVMLFLIMNFHYLPDEEERLSKMFGDEYLAYKNNVRRWI